MAGVGRCRRQRSRVVRFRCVRIFCFGTGKELFSVGQYGTLAGLYLRCIRGRFFYATRWRRVVRSYRRSLRQETRTPDLSRTDDRCHFCRMEATERALRAGADAASLTVLEIDDIPIAYLPGDARRVRVRVIADIANFGQIDPIAQTEETSASMEATALVP